MKEVKLFSGTNSKYIAEPIADYYGYSLGNLTVNRFSDGEMQTIIEESVRGASVFFIQSTFAPADNLLELLLLIDSAKRASAGYITAVIPYFGYARQDRKDKPRVPISAKMIANILESAGVNRVITMDLHADQIQGFFDIPVDHLRSEAIFIPYLKQQGLDNVIFASPDVGGVKRARTFAKYFNVKGADVILVDDMADTAGTLCKAADVLMAKGAKSVKALCTHAVLSGKAYENIEKSQLQQLIVCDTLPLKQKTEKIKVLSCAKLFAKAIRNTHEYRSIAALFVD